ncbi:rhamnogalacturonan lyase [Promicromonospora sp. NPDC059942]|uniref:rhamnogalacturonan lyase n=1 Tax=Promicromonospora sp. NPDC059942 TaxID=3347009 RepID=UPI003667CEAD
MRTTRTTVGAVAVLMVGALAVGGGPAGAQPGPGSGPGSAGNVQLEHLDRGLVAASTSEGVFLSWRLLVDEVTGHTDAGMAGADFVVYRDGRRVATVTDSTNYVDAAGGAASRYAVAPVTRGKGGGERIGTRSAPVTAWSDGHLDIPLNKPADGVTPAGESFTYSANDASVADLDRDGELEIVLKWDPSNSKDVSQKGYTGNAYLDAYELDGTQLWRIDLGVNIRAGAHYTQFPVYDFDGDGQAEVMMKTAPGTKVTTYRNGRPAGERYVPISREDRRAGVTDGSDFRWSAADYADHLVELFQGWTDEPEVRSGQWPATLEEAFGIEQRYTYPLSAADARELVDYYIDEWAPARSDRNDLRTFAGFVQTGPEYLTVFDGRSGRPLETVDYEPGRTDDGLRWGDYEWTRIEPGNRVDRFLSGVAYLDGEHPSAIFARGYYTRAAIVAYDWDGRDLSTRWVADSGFKPMNNPFLDSENKDVEPDPDNELTRLWGQGFHSLSAADVDGDGRHEIVYGAATLDDDGTLLYSSSDTLPEGSADPGATANLGHGDAMHVTDVDPSRPGLEIWTCHEGGAGVPYGSVLRDAATGEALFGAYSGVDTGRALLGDVRPDVPGLEVWRSAQAGDDRPRAAGLLSATGELLDQTGPGLNQSIRWAGDGTTQVVSGDREETPTIEDWSRGTVLTAEGTRTNNYWKGNPSLVADILGDWREELVLPTVDSSALRIYTSTEVSGIKMYTLLHDPQYRAEVARQQTTYNQPSHPGFYLASDTDWSRVPVPSLR